jgi:hypothetical protein
MRTHLAFQLLTPARLEMLFEFIPSRRLVVLSRIQRGNRAHEQAKFLFNAHKAEIDSSRRTVIEGRLVQ